MADNVPITAGTGTNIATDDDGTAHHQWMKMEFGLNGTFTPVDSVFNPLPTTPRVDQQRIEVTSGGLTTTATAYTAGDQVGTQFTFTNAARFSDGMGVITGIQVVSAADTPTTMDIIFFDSSVTLAADNAAFSISDADALKFVSLVQLTGFYDIGNNRVAFSYGLSVPYTCAGGTSLFGALITRGSIAATPFAAATDIQVGLYVERY